MEKNVIVFDVCIRLKDPEFAKLDHQKDMGCRGVVTKMANGVNANGSITKAKRAMNSPCDWQIPTRLAIPGWPGPHRSSRAAKCLESAKVFLKSSPKML